MQSTMHVYEVRPRKVKCGVDLISDALRFGRLLSGEPNATTNAISCAKLFTRSHEHAGEFKEWVRGSSISLPMFERRRFSYLTDSKIIGKRTARSYSAQTMPTQSTSKRIEEVIDLTCFIHPPPTVVDILHAKGFRGCIL